MCISMEATISTNNTHPLKMHRFIVALFAIVVIISATSAYRPACPPNEYWSQCQGHCQPTCSVREPMCTAICKPGCRCNCGWLRDRSGACIPPNACPRFPYEPRPMY